MEHLPYKSLYMSSYYRNASICLTLATSTLSSLATLDVLFLDIVNMELSEARMHGATQKTLWSRVISKIKGLL